jgi:hypothetical protein
MPFDGTCLPDSPLAWLLEAELKRASQQREKVKLRSKHARLIHFNDRCISYPEIRAMMLFARELAQRVVDSRAGQCERGSGSSGTENAVQPSKNLRWLAGGARPMLPIQVGRSAPIRTCRESDLY